MEGLALIAAIPHVIGGLKLALRCSSDLTSPVLAAEGHQPFGRVGKIPEADQITETAARSRWSKRPGRPSEGVRTCPIGLPAVGSRGGADVCGLEPLGGQAWLSSRNCSPSHPLHSIARPRLQPYGVLTWSSRYGPIVLFATVGLLRRSPSDYSIKSSAPMAAQTSRQGLFRFGRGLSAEPLPQWQR